MVGLLRHLILTLLSRKETEQERLQTVESL